MGNPNIARSLTALHAAEAMESRQNSLSKLDTALNDSKNADEFWNTSQNALTAELNSADGWKALANYMGAKGREYAGTQEALDAANTMATLYENGSDEKDPELFDTKMAEAEAKIRGVFDAIYEKKESSRSREQVGQSSEGENTNLDERVDARLENQDFTLLVKNYSAQFQEYGGWLKEMGGRVDPAEFSGVMDGIQKMLGGDLSRIVKPGKLDAFTLGELKSSLQEIKRSLGPLRQGTTSEVARLAFEDVSKFIENLP